MDLFFNSFYSLIHRERLKTKTNHYDNFPVPDRDIFISVKIKIVILGRAKHNKMPLGMLRQNFKPADRESECGK